MNVLCGVASQSEESYGVAAADIKENLDGLVRSYPGQIAGYDSDFLILKNGIKFQLSDGRTNKTFKDLLETPDIDDMFYARYPVGTEPDQPDKNSDPGRVRFEPLFVAMYGDCNKNEVVRNLRTIDWLPKHAGGQVTITSVNGVARALENVSRELDALPDQLVKYLVPTAGTYNCRKIAGSPANRCTPTGLPSISARNLLTIGGGLPAAERNPDGEIESQFRSCGFLRHTASSGVAIGTISTRCTSNIAQSFWPANRRREPAALTMPSIYTLMMLNSGQLIKSKFVARTASGTLHPWRELHENAADLHIICKTSRLRLPRSAASEVGGLSNT